MLELVEAAKPEPKPEEVVVRTHAASVNPLDWHFMRGTPAPVRLMTGIFRPRNGRLGVDLAGVVEAVGSKVTRFQEGEEVFGAARGTFAEYVSARADRLVGKPGNISFEQAAAVPIAALTALQSLRDKGGLRPEQVVLVIGVGGDGGTMKMLLDLLKVRVVSPFVSQRFVSFIASLNGTDLGALAELMESGKVTPVIDRSYPLERVADAVRYLETRHARGKVVVTIC